MALSIQDISTEYLPILENLMIEYFEPNINSQRREEIKHIVNRFSQEDNAWCFAIRFICEAKSDYTKVYCFSVLHNFILKNWSSLTEQIKNELKDYIWTNLIKFHIQTNHSLFIQNKLCQMISTIVRLSFPHFWPNYFNELADLITNIDTMELGIRLLNITLEELLMPSEDLDEERKKELNRLISNQVPLIVNVLSSIMRDISNKYNLNSLFVTPPASPIESMNYPQTIQNEDNYIQTNNNKQINLKSICLSIKNLLDNIDDKSLDVLELILQCNLTLFNWLSINDFYPLLNESMLELLFIFATFGCSNGSKETKIGILTLTCINELLSKNYINNEFSSKFYFSLFDVVIKILFIIDTEIDLDRLDNEYVMKFMDSIRYFVINPISCNQDDLSFYLNFLEKLFYLTFKEKWNKQYHHLIEIWINLLNIFLHLNPNCNLDSNEPNFNDNQDDLGMKLSVASNELFKQVLIKLQYRLNGNQLEELDTEELNDYGQTELQVYFNCNFEVLFKIAQLLPNQTSKILSELFEELIKIFLNIDQLLGQSFSLENERIITEYLSIEDSNNLDYTLKDCKTLISVWQRLSEHFIGTKFTNSIQIVQTLLDQIINCLDYSNRFKLFTFDCNRLAIVQDLNELHQSFLLFLKFYSSWITQFRNESTQNEQTSYYLIKRICDECVRTIMIILEKERQDPKIIKMNCETIQSSLLCLLTVSCSIRPKISNESSIQILFDKLFLSINKTSCSTCVILNEKNRYNYMSILNKDSCTNCKFINQLQTLPSNKCTNLKIENQQELVWLDTLSNILILPWPQLQDNLQEWEMRSEKHKTLIYAFYADLLKQFKDQPSSLNQSIPIQSPISSTLKRTLFLFTNLVNNHVESPTKSKQILLTSLIEFLEFILTILPANVLNDDLGESILSFLISVLEVFRSQIKLPFIEQIIKILLNSVSQNNLLDSKQIEIKNSLVEKVFKIFTFIVEQPAASFKILIPNMLDVALNQMYQAVIQSNSNDLYSTFYEFLYKFLLNNSKFFFKNQLTQQFNNNMNNINNSLANCSLINEPVTNQQYFFRIFEFIFDGFSNSFIKSNMHLFKQNLVALDALNFRQKLFHKQLFKENLLHHFILLFIQTMINNEHKILHDELISLIYSLALADYNVFKTICLFEFVAKLTNCCTTNFTKQYGQLLSKECIEDAPTFNKNFISFINGIKFYRNSNVLLV